MGSQCWHSTLQYVLHKATSQNFTKCHPPPPQSLSPPINSWHHPSASTHTCCSVTTTTSVMMMMMVMTPAPTHACCGAITIASMHTCYGMMAMTPVPAHTYTMVWQQQQQQWQLRPQHAVSQSVDLGRSNNPNTTPTKDYKIVRVVVCLRGVQRGCAEEGERGSTPTGWCRQRCRILLGYRSDRRRRG